MLVKGDQDGPHMTHLKVFVLVSFWGQVQISAAPLSGACAVRRDRFRNAYGRRQTIVLCFGVDQSTEVTMRTTSANYFRQNKQRPTFQFCVIWRLWFNLTDQNTNYCCFDKEVGEKLAFIQ